MKGIVRVVIAEHRDGRWTACILGSSNPEHYSGGPTRADALEALRLQLQRAESKSIAAVDEVVLRLDVPVEGAAE